MNDDDVGIDTSSTATTGMTGMFSPDGKPIVGRRETGGSNSKKKLRLMETLVENLGNMGEKVNKKSQVEEKEMILGLLEKTLEKIATLEEQIEYARDEKTKFRLTKFLGYRENMAYELETNIVRLDANIISFN